MATGLQPSYVRVASSGHVWLAAQYTAAPTDVSVAPSGSWTDLGYTSEDGITFSIEQTTEDIMGWQSLDPLRTVVTAEPKSFNFTLRQLQRSTFTAAFAGSYTDQTNKWKWVPSAAGSQTFKAYLLEFKDDVSNLNYRFWFGNCTNQGAREINFVRNNAVNIPMDLKVLTGTGNTWEMYTDDNTAFGASS